MEFGGGPGPRLHCDRDCGMPGWRPRADGSCSWETPGIPVAQRESLAWKEHRLFSMAAAAENCGRPGVGSSVPGERKTLVVFFLFFHLARLF